MHRWLRMPNELNALLRDLSGRINPFNHIWNQLILYLDWKIDCVAGTSNTVLKWTRWFPSLLAFRNSPSYYSSSFFGKFSFYMTCFMSFPRDFSSIYGGKTYSGRLCLIFHTLNLSTVRNIAITFLMTQCFKIICAWLKRYIFALFCCMGRCITNKMNLRYFTCNYFQQQSTCKFQL